MLTQVCMGCGEVCPPEAMLERAESCCFNCGTDFRERPPSSYARMEGFLEFERPRPTHPDACPERTLETRTFERWIGFVFFACVILMGLIALIRG